MTRLISIALGDPLYGERFTNDPTDLTLGAITFVTMCLGVLLYDPDGPGVDGAAPRELAHCDVNCDGPCRLAKGRAAYAVEFAR